MSYYAKPPRARTAHTSEAQPLPTSFPTRASTAKVGEREKPASVSSKEATESGALGHGLESISIHAASTQAAQKKEPEATSLSQDDHQVQTAMRPTSDGSRLPSAVQSKMEGAFGHDFSKVRVHEGGAAPSIGALAYAQGNDLHFAPGRYEPHSSRGQELLGHELSHVVQQRQGRVTTPQGKGVPINADPTLETEADLMGARAAQGKATSASGLAATLGAKTGIQRKAPNPCNTFAPIQCRPSRKKSGEEKYAEGIDLAGSALSPGGLGASIGEQVHTVANNTSGIADSKMAGSGLGLVDLLSAPVSALGVKDAISDMHQARLNKDKRQGIEGAGLFVQNASKLGTTITGATSNIATLAGATTGGWGTLAGSAVPGLGIALGGMDMIRGGYNIAKGVKGRKEMGALQESLTGSNDELAKVATYAQETHTKRAKRAGINTTAGALTTAGGIATVSGAAAPVGAGLAMGGSLLKLGAYGLRKLKQHYRDKAEENGTDSYLGIKVNTEKSSLKKKERGSQMVDTLVAHSGTDEAQAMLRSIGASKKMLADFAQYNSLGPEEQEALKTEAYKLFRSRE